MYLLATDLDALVLEYREIVQGATVWNPVLRRPAFDWKVGNITALLEKLDPMWLMPLLPFTVLPKSKTQISSMSLPHKLIT